MDSIDITAPAKINLRLEILSKRPDGYHEISTLFQKVGLYDDLTLRSASAGISLSVDAPGIPCDSTNLAYRAAELIMKRCGIHAGVSIALTKRIPAGAGLGGGSSDAAAVLEGCNRLFDLGLPRGELQKLALGLGADVPFFLSPWPTAHARGIGEILTEARLAPELWFVIIFPPFGISTAWAYAEFSKEILTKKRKNSNLPHSIEDARELGLLLHNDFELVAIPKHPEIAAIKRHLLNAGAAGALMSGSGSSVFGFFESSRACHEAARKLESVVDGAIFTAPSLR